MRAVTAKPAAGLPVAAALDAIPGLVRQAVDTRDLIVGRHAGLVLGLKVAETQDIQVEQVWVVPLEIADLATERDGACWWWC